MEQLLKWQQEQFLPWVNAAQVANRQQTEINGLLRERISEIKHMLALIIEGEEVKATLLWNRLNIGLALTTLDFDPETGTLTFLFENGDHKRVQLTDFLMKIKELMHTA